MDHLYTYLKKLGGVVPPACHQNTKDQIAQLPIERQGYTVTDGGDLIKVTVRVDVTSGLILAEREEV